MNQISHWLDASNVYGSEKEIADNLRDKTGGTGRLRSTRVTGHGRDDRLPECNGMKWDINGHEPESCSGGPPSKNLFGAGTCENGNPPLSFSFILIEFLI